MADDVMNDALTNETVELLQAMIRNECVNTGYPESGNEIRNVDLLQTFLEGPGVEIQTYEPTPNRASLVARLEGTDPSAPTVCLMGHTDVVPVSPEGWDEDPFAGQIIDGEVWGRGAVDMLNLTSSMAVAFRNLARNDFRPKGDLIYFAVADEEAGGGHGAGWFADNDYDPIKADYVLTESGGIPLPGSGEPRLAMTVAEKGVGWRKIVVHGTPGHGSRPFRADNALVTAAEVIRRLVDYRPNPLLTDIWAGQVEALGYEGEMKAALLDPARVFDAIDSIESDATAARLHACTHTTFSPNMAQGGTKHNTIPDRVSINVDIRTLPGETSEDVEAHMKAALGDLYRRVEVVPVHEDPSTASPIETPMWATLTELAGRKYPGVRLVPTMTTGGTDSRFYRAKGAVAYGAGLFSQDVTYETFSSRFHGNNERIDIESLALTTQMWLGVAERFWEVAG